jgi:hypothetical protein
MAAKTKDGDDVPRRIRAGRIGDMKRKHYTTSIEQGTRLLKEDELDNVSGGFYNDNGCTHWARDSRGRIIVPDGLNGWLIPGSPQRPNG